MSCAMFYLGSVARRLGVNLNYLFDTPTALQRGEPLRLSVHGDEGTGTAQATRESGEAVTVSRAHFDRLHVVEAHRLCCTLRYAAHSDEGTDCFGPIIDMIECSIFARPSIDVQTLAAKVWATSFPFSETDPAEVALRDDIEGILAQGLEGKGSAQVASGSDEAVTITRAQVAKLTAAEAQALWLAVWYSKWAVLLPAAGSADHYNRLKELAEDVERALAAPD